MTTVSTFLMLIASFSPALDARTAERLAVLGRGALLSPRSRTVTSCLGAAWPWVKKGWQAYGNLLRRAKIPMLQLARILFGLVAGLIPEDRPIHLMIDETLVRRWGPYVPGLGMHRDPVRSCRTRHAVCPGQGWVVLSVLVRLPYMNRPVALPILSALYTPPNPPSRNHAEPLYRRHRTAVELGLILVRLLVRWAPERRFILCGDGAYGTHMLARALRPDSRLRALRRVSLVSRFYFDAALYGQPGPYSGTGRPRLKGKRLPSPEEAIEQASDGQWERAAVQWYGGQSKVVLLLSGRGLWYKASEGAKQVRWVVCRRPDSEHKDEVFFTTDPDLSPSRIVEIYVGRWSLETTFQEAREHLGLETLRNWSATAVGRSVPMLLGLYSLAVVWFERHVEQPEDCCIEWPWYEKRHVTFSDMLTAARADILSELVFQRPGKSPGEEKLGPENASLPIGFALTGDRAKRRAA